MSMYFASLTQHSDNCLKMLNYTNSFKRLKKLAFLVIVRCGHLYIFRLDSNILGNLTCILMISERVFLSYFASSKCIKDAVI